VATLQLGGERKKEEDDKNPTKTFSSLHFFWSPKNIKRNEIPPVEKKKRQN
jgi:hypothetical protein